MRSVPDQLSTFFFLDLRKKQNNNISCVKNHKFVGDIMDHIGEMSALVMDSLYKTTETHLEHRPYTFLSARCSLSPVKVSNCDILNKRSLADNLHCQLEYQ